MEKKVIDMVLKLINDHIMLNNSHTNKISIEDIKETEEGLIFNNKVAQLDTYHIGQVVALARAYYGIKHSYAYMMHEPMEFNYVTCEPCFKESKVCNCLAE